MLNRTKEVSLKAVQIEGQINFLPKEYAEFHKSLDTREFITELDITHKSGDTAEQISQKEYQIATLIQEETNKFPIGSSILLERLLQEVNIKYLKTGNGRILLITNNHEIKWLGQSEGQETVTNNRQPITITDIAPLLQRESQINSLNFNHGESNITISKSKKIKIHTLRNLAKELHEKGNNPESIKVCRKLVKINPQNISNYIYLGNLLIISRQYKEAVEISHQGIKIDDKNIKLYSNLAYALTHNPTLAYNSDTHSTEEAINVYKKVIELANGDEKWQIYINQAESGIRDLEILLKAKAEMREFEEKYYPREIVVRGQEHNDSQHS